MRLPYHPPRPGLQEGARDSELGDLRRRVVRQLALIVVDAAAAALEANAGNSQGSVPEVLAATPAQILKYGE